ncbi:Transmembrane protein 132C [Dissostichus eleginoides]|uniref:Transmembrane protein 132C n=1 Tax=Dissostichus eleginoides TaxID=100907 RepID=A0AAD9B595_DISEL|nr:Transmembrane protein 132C [Dissostichus eleginoides]
MVLEVQKKDSDLQLLDELMIPTFSQRRKEIIGDEPLISAIKERWPALFGQRQLCAEFSRIVTKDLLKSFLEGLDAMVPSLLEAYKAAVASGRRLALSGVLQCLQKEDTNQNSRTAALLGLPIFIPEDSSNVIRMCDAHGETLDVILKGMQVGLLIGHEGPLLDSFPLEVFNVAVVVEEKIILHDLRDVPTGFAMLMGAIYCLNPEYPRNMKYSFEFFQKEASISVWLQFSDDTASLLSSFWDLPFFLHLSSLAETVVVVTPIPSQHIFAKGDGGGPLLRAELLVSTCTDQPITSNSISEGERDWMDSGRGGTRRLAGGSGWIRVNLDHGFLLPDGERDEEGDKFGLHITDTLVESDSDIYAANFDGDESENVSSDYYNKIDVKRPDKNWNDVGNRGMDRRSPLRGENREAGLERAAEKEEEKSKKDERNKTEGEDRIKQHDMNNKEDIKEVEIIC